MKRYFIIPLAMMFSSMLFSQGVYNNGGKIVVGPGVTFNVNGSNGNFRNETNVTNGSMDLKGTFKIQGNIINNVASADVFTSTDPASEVILNGTTFQTIGGSANATITFSNLTVDNISGVNISKNAIVNGIMSLINGKIDIGNNSFTFGPFAVVSGTPSASNMIIATGTGEVHKEWTVTGAFTFPVGDNTVIPEYSPLTLNFTSGTFAAGALAGVNLVNAKHPGLSAGGSYLNRYWNVDQTGISAFTADVVFQYEVADVVGTETDLFNERVSPAPLTLFDPANTPSHQLTATGLTSFGTFTGGPGNKILSLKLFIEGLYIGGGAMHQAQGVAGNQFPGLTADVINVELHDAVTYATIVYTVSNVDLSTNGLASVSIPAAYSGSYYLTIRHRNSIETVSAMPVSFASSSINYDFSSFDTQTYFNNVKNIGGVFVIYSGDVDQDGFVGVSDMGRIDNQSSAFGFGYMPEDVDGDGFVGVSDMGVIDNNSVSFVFTVTP